MPEPTPANAELPTVTNIRVPYHPPVLESWGVTEGPGEEALGEMLQALGVEHPGDWHFYTAIPDTGRFPSNQPKRGDTSTDIVIPPEAITGRFISQHYDRTNTQHRLNTARSRAASLLVRRTACQAVRIERDGHSSAELIPIVALGTIAVGVASAVIETKYFGGPAQELDSTGPAIYGAAALGSAVIYLRSGWREARRRAARVRDQQPELIKKLRENVVPNFRVHPVDQQTSPISK